MFTLIILLHLALAIEISIIELVRRKNKIIIFDFLTSANIFFLIGYCIVPLYYLNASRYIEIMPNSFYLDNVAIYIFLAYQFFILGWGLFRRKKYNFKSHSQISQIDYKWLKMAYFSFFILLLMMILVVIGDGGISKYLSGALSRYSVEEQEVGGFAFLSRLTNVLPFIAAIFFYFLINKDKEHNYKYIKIFFLLTTVLTVFQIIGGASRGGMVRFFLLLFLVYILVKNKLKIIPLSILSVLAFLFIIYGKQTFYATANFISKGESFYESFKYMDNIRNDAGKEGNSLFFTEFSHPYKSLDASIRYENKNYEYTYFRDFYWSALRIFPSRLVSIFLERPEPIHILNTSLLTGVSGVGGIPPGLIASFYYSLGILGIFLASFLYGALGAVLNNYFNKMINSSKIYYVPLVFFSYFYGFFIVNGDPNIYIYYILSPIIFMFFLKFIRNVDR